MARVPCFQAFDGRRQEPEDPGAATTVRSLAPIPFNGRHLAAHAEPAPPLVVTSVLSGHDVALTFPCKTVITGRSDPRVTIDARGSNERG